MNIKSTRGLSSTICFLFVGLVSGCAQASAPASNSHCSAVEKTLFSCRVKSDKVVSLCSSAQLTKNEGYLQYRFGKLGKIELEHPKARSHSINDFMFSDYTRPKVTQVGVAFEKGAYLYRVFDLSNQEDPNDVFTQSGIEVVKSGKSTIIECTQRAQNELGSLKSLLKSDMTEATNQ